MKRKIEAPFPYFNYTCVSAPFESEKKADEVRVKYFPGENVVVLRIKGLFYLFSAACIG